MYPKMMQIVSQYPSVDFFKVCQDSRSPNHLSQVHIHVSFGLSLLICSQYELANAGSVTGHADMAPSHMSGKASHSFFLHYPKGHHKPYHLTPAPSWSSN